MYGLLLASNWYALAVVTFLWFCCCLFFWGEGLYVILGLIVCFFSTCNIPLQTDIAQGSGGGRGEDIEEL